MRVGALAGKACIVTGGARGIGRAVVERFLAEGALGVVAVDRSGSELDQLAAAFPGQVTTVTGDVRDHQTHARAVASCVEAFGGVDVLVGNAGVFDFRKKLESYEPEQLAAAMDELFGINVRGYLVAVHCAATR
jgi:NAD(P)-dependent dehydrogenase (short-subunit alcohol dehydrogenase family)